MSAALYGPSLNRFTGFFMLAAIVLSATSYCSNAQPSAPVKTGAEVLLQSHLAQLEGKRIGAVVNHTSQVGGTHLIDTLLSSGINVISVFAPEHGFRGDVEAGATISNEKDAATGIPVYSLYGKLKKPSAEMLDGIDLLLFDMQDVGARFYTYNSTMKYILEAAADQDIPVWILDRPNPAGGEYISGWILEDEFTSFVGSYPIPIAHGLTLGELALMSEGEGWLDTGSESDIRVIRMQGWKRSMKWPETGLRWIPPSPNLPTFEHAYTYLGTCMLEGTNLSEGRGTADPFKLTGAPQLNADTLALQTLGKKYGFTVRPTSFIPRSIKGVAEQPKYQDQQVSGFMIKFGDTIPEDPVRFGVELTQTLVQSDSMNRFNSFVMRLAGTRSVTSDESPDWDTETALFREQRRPYLLYD